MRYMVISATAAYTGIPESALRTRLAYRRLPGFYSGHRFYVDVPKLVDMIEKETEHYSNGGVTELPEARIQRNRPHFTRSEYAIRKSRLEAFDMESEKTDQEAEFVLELRTLYDRGRFN